jgi:uncharacterized YigZ family protein
MICRRCWSEAVSDAVETLAAAASFEQVIKHSRFLAQAEPVSALADIEAAIARLSLTPASHHCWAWRCGESWRSQDAGEPAGTAGRPILAAIDGQGLSDVLVVVSRWFGGIKLGSGGLVRAYGGTAAECLRTAPRRTLIRRSALGLLCAADDLGTVRHLLGQADALLETERWRVDGVELRVQAPTEGIDDLWQALSDATRGRTQMMT